MKTPVNSSSAITPAFNENLSLISRFARILVFAQLKKITEGQIIVRENGQAHVFGKPSQRFPTSVQVDIHDVGVWQDIALGGSVGSGEAYMRGRWTCTDLLTLVRLFLRNERALDGLDQRATRLLQGIDKIRHGLKRNSKRGSRRNISAHYDLGNEFFSVFLDSSLMYSSAIYPTPETELESAAAYKLDYIAQKLNLVTSDHVLEIGTGWGGFAMHVAKHYGCRVTTTTISQEQFKWASQRVREAGLQDKVTVLLKDYREIKGQYDKLVSIEMVEAVGHQYLDTYFKRCAQLLKPEGAMLLQAITITDQYYDRALQEVDFIKKYIFPGGFLPSITRMGQAITQFTDMKVLTIEDIGHHYAQTLADWRMRFTASLHEVKALGYSERFINMWAFYLSYCQAGFMERRLGAVQMVMIKPDNRSIY